MAVVRLPRLPGNVSIVDDRGISSITFAQWWDKVASEVETSLNAILAIPEIEEALSQAQVAIDAANEAAANAQAAADNAQNAADQSAASTSLQGSYPEGVTLSASDSGTDATIAIGAHTRVYSDGSSVAVDAGTVGGLNYSTTYYVYYLDVDRVGGSVTYFATTVEADAAQTGDRHTVGSVMTPASAGPPSSGHIVRPPGVGAIP